MLVSLFKIIIINKSWLIKPAKFLVPADLVTLCEESVEDPELLIILFYKLSTLMLAHCFLYMFCL